MYDFDLLTTRRGTNSMKWDEPAADGQVADYLPMWVADMDFVAAPPIVEALRKRVEHGIFGYTFVPGEYYDAVVSWFSRRHGWTIQAEHILYTSGVVPAVSCCLKAMTMPGEKVLLQTPAYNCFFSSIRNSGCEPLCSDLCPTTEAGGMYAYTVDWADFEAKCADPKTTVFLLCNPHNPVGRVWTRPELEQMRDICHRHGVAIVADEIHCELTMPGYTYVPFGTVDPEAVVLNSPSKSFNTAGLQIANIVCQPADLRRRIDRAININEVCDVNPFGVVALIAAYNEGAQWLDELRDYLYGNYQLLCSFFAERLPQLKLTRLEGTYLVWADVTAFGADADAVAQRLLSEGGVWVSSSTMYGGQGFIRINIACPRSRMKEGLERIAQTLARMLPKN